MGRLYALAEQNRYEYLFNIYSFLLSLKSIVLSVLRFTTADLPLWYLL